ncbi:MAG TPA: hypothetical protein VGM20_12610 [Gemmatimonadales bacterium]|jgi:hypothetical protein
MRSHLFAAVVGVSALVACSGTSVPDPPSVSGTWDFTYSSVSSQTITCHGKLKIAITQTGEDFTGQQVGAGIVGCAGATPALTTIAANDTDLVLGNEVLHAGRSDNGDVAFVLEELQTQDHGSLTSSTTMSGTSTWTLPVEPAGSVILHGNWTATKE